MSLTFFLRPIWGVVRSKKLGPTLGSTEREMKTKSVTALVISAICAGPLVAQASDVEISVIIGPAQRGYVPYHRAYDIPLEHRLSGRTMLPNNSMLSGEMTRMQGKTVYGFTGEILGTILTVD